MKSESESLLARLIRSKFVFFVIFIIFVLSSISLINEVGRRQKIQNEIDSQKEMISGLESENRQLAQLLDYLKTNNFVEQEARQKLNLSKPGESLIIVDSKDSQDGTMAAADNIAEKWYTYFFK